MKALKLERVSDDSWKPSHITGPNSFRSNKSSQNQISQVTCPQGPQQVTLMTFPITMTMGPNYLRHLEIQNLNNHSKKSTNTKFSFSFKCELQKEKTPSQLQVPIHPYSSSPPCCNRPPGRQICWYPAVDLLVSGSRPSIEAPHEVFGPCSKFQVDL